MSVYAASLGGTVCGGVEGKYGNYHNHDLPQWISSVGVISAGVITDTIIGIAAVVIGALVVAHVIPLPMALGTALITGGGLYMLLGLSCGTNAIPLLAGYFAGVLVGEELAEET